MFKAILYKTKMGRYSLMRTCSFFHLEAGSIILASILIPSFCQASYHTEIANYLPHSLRLFIAHHWDGHKYLIYTSHTKYTYMEWTQYFNEGREWHCSVRWPINPQSNTDILLFFCKRAASITRNATHTYSRIKIQIIINQLTQKYKTCNF